LKITIFGLTLSSSWGNGHATPYRAIIRALHRMGHHVTFYEKDVDYYRAHRDFSSCDYCDLVLYPDWDSVRSFALAEAAEADVVLVGSYCPEGARINDDLLELRGPMRAFYDLDTPITLANLCYGSIEYLRRDQMREFDLYLSFTGGSILDTLETDYEVRLARALYGCVDSDLHARVAPQSAFACDLSYMGTHAPDRQEKLERLFVAPAQRLPGRSFLLAGSLYPRNWSWPTNVRKLEHIPPDQHASLYSSSRLTLNITRNGMARTGYCPSGRFFEAAACGTPIVTDWFEGLDAFFVPGDEVFVANSTDDVVSAVLTYDQDLRAMAGRARERALSEHTGDCRARELLRCLEDARWPALNRARVERGASQRSGPGTLEVAS